MADTNTISKVSYSPYRAVVRNDVETTKVRIVYDASCFDRRAGSSLNDCLHVGSSLTPLRFDMLIRFREKPIVLVGDIEKESLNIEADPTTRNYGLQVEQSSLWSELLTIFAKHFSPIPYQ